MSYHHATLKVGNLLPVKCPQSNAPSRSLAPLVKTHTKLPMLAAYRYHATSYRNRDRCKIRICGYYWQFSVGFKTEGCNHGYKILQVYTLGCYYWSWYLARRGRQQISTTTTTTTTNVLFVIPVLFAEFAAATHCWLDFNGDNRTAHGLCCVETILATLIKK